VIRSPAVPALPTAGLPLSCSHTPWNSQPGSRCSPPDPGFCFYTHRERRTSTPQQCPQMQNSNRIGKASE
jgi:hypothetical protein